MQLNMAGKTRERPKREKERGEKQSCMFIFLKKTKLGLMGLRVTKWEQLLQSYCTETDYIEAQKPDDISCSRGTLMRFGLFLLMRNNYMLGMCWDCLPNCQ